MINKITFFLPNLNSGGAQKVTLKILKLLLEKSFEIDLVIVKNSGELVNEVYGIKGINIIDLKCSRTAKSIFKFSKYIKQSKTDLIISAMNYSNIIAIISRGISLTNTKLIITEHSTISRQVEENGIKGKLIGILAKKLYIKADKIIGVSKGVSYDLENFLNIKNKKITTIYNPIITKDFYNKANIKLKNSYYLDDKVIKLIYVGRLAKEKRVENILFAFKEVLKKYKCKLFILGEGSEKEKLIKICNELNIEKSVYFLGYIENPYFYMKNSDILILASDREGLPSVLIEGLALGLKIVSTDCQYGPREILENGELGILVKVNDVCSLKTGIIEAIESRTKSIDEGKIIKYSGDKVLERYLKEINNLNQGR